MKFSSVLLAVLGVGMFFVLFDRFAPNPPEFMLYMLTSTFYGGSLFALVLWNESRENA